jgi:transposase-like protein
MHRLVKEMYSLKPKDMSAAAFCRNHGINENTFRTWQRKANPVSPQVRVLDDILQKMGYRLVIERKGAI